jgi:hypothetical protein
VKTWGHAYFFGREKKEKEKHQIILGAMVL